MTDWTQVPEPEFTTEYLAINAEAGRRRTLATAESDQDALNTRVLQAEGIKQGDPWRQPTGAHDAYPKDAQVSWAGKDWSSTISGNVWEPGVSGWQEIGVEWPDWVQPAGTHDSYAVGAKVTHNAQHWISNTPDNVWEPGVHGWDVAP